MEVDTPALQDTSKGSSASVVARSAKQRANASQSLLVSTDPRPRPDPNTKQLAMTQQGIRDIVPGVLENRGMSQEDWEQSPKTDYRVDPMPPPEWSVPKPPGTHLSTMEGEPVGEWCMEPTVTPDVA